MTAIFVVVGTQSYAQLRVDGRVDRMLVCDGDGKFNNFYFDLRLIVQNIGDEPLVVSTSHAVVAYWRMAPEPSVLETLKYNHIAWIMFPLVDIESLPTSPPETYRVLEKEESVEIPAGSRLLVATKQRPGKHYLQVVAENIYYSAEDAERLAQKWRQHGRLWVKALRSEPIEFEFPATLERGDCPP
ncbi:MAG: hypothetical protein HYX74_06605 [Acidobacteria bacterium]|nr:hypothetical protein [Acidobacteriota bacterium]